MRIDVQALRSMWRQTVWVTGFVIVGVVAMMVYFMTSTAPDYAAIGFLLLLLFAMPLMLGVAYLIRRTIERSAD